MPTGAEDVRFRGKTGGNPPLTDLGSGSCDTAVDFTAKRNKIDGLGQECLGTAFQGFPPRTVIAVGS